MPSAFQTLKHSKTQTLVRNWKTGVTALGLLRPLRGSAFGLGQPDAFGAGEFRRDDLERLELVGFNVANVGMLPMPMLPITNWHWESLGSHCLIDRLGDCLIGANAPAIWRWIADDWIIAREGRACRDRREG